MTGDLKWSPNKRVECYSWDYFKSFSETWSLAGTYSNYRLALLNDLT